MYTWRSGDSTPVQLRFNSIVLGDGSHMPQHVVSAVPTGGATPYKTLSLVATVQTVKAGAGIIYGGLLQNRCMTAERYVKFWDAATAPTIGTTTPTWTVWLCPGETVMLEAPSPGIQFANGIYFAATQLIGDTDNTAPNANDVLATLFYN